MTEAPGDQTCVKRWQHGDEQAAAQLYHRYLERLCNVAQRRLSSKVAARFDAEDVAQSALKSFFVRAKEGQFAFNESDDVWKLLVQITIHKALKQIDFHRCAKRDPGAEIGSSDQQRDLLLAHLAKEPTPDEAAMFVDEMEHYLQQLRPEDRRIVEMRLEGFDNQEIAAKLGISDRKIRRLLERIRGQAEQDRPRL